MSKICINCKKTIGFFSPDPYEIDENQILCYDCANPIKENMIKLYYVKNEKEFNEVKNSILTASKKNHTENIHKLIQDKIKNIKTTVEYEETNEEKNKTENTVLENDNKQDTYEKTEEDFEETLNQTNAIYSIDGVRGKHLDVYEDKIIINTKANIGSFITGNVTDAEKTIYYVDCIGVQFKKSGALIGYLQLETSSTQMNNRNDNFFSENSFTYDTSKVSNEKMIEIVNYIKKRIDNYKNQKSIQQPQAYSAADEIKKFKELLDLDIITKEEFEAKKKQLLNL